MKKLLLLIMLMISIVSYSQCDTFPTLSVKFTSFQVNVDSKLCKIEWNTQQEINNKYFVVEKSMDGKSFDSLVSVKPNNLGYYYAYDEMQTCAYYRIKQVDNDTRYSYSKIVFANARISGISITPNPFKNELNLSLYAKVRGMYKVFVRDMLGSLVLSKPLYLGSGANFVKINTDSISPGVYVITIANDSKSVILSQKILK